MNWNAANNWRSEIEAGLQHDSKEGLRFANALLIGAGSLTGLVWAAYVLAGYHTGFIALKLPFIASLVVIPKSHL